MPAHFGMVKLLITFVTRTSRTRTVALTDLALELLGATLHGIKALELSSEDQNFRRLERLLQNRKIKTKVGTITRRIIIRSLVAYSGEYGIEAGGKVTTVEVRHVGFKYDTLTDQINSGMSKTVT